MGHARGRLTGDDERHLSVNIMSIDINEINIFLNDTRLSEIPTNINLKLEKLTYSPLFEKVDLHALK